VNCSNCGAGIPAGFTHCTSCGAVAPSVAAPPPPPPAPPSPPTAPGYGAPGAPQPPYAGTPQYGTPQYGVPQYGVPQYGAPHYGVPQPGTPSYLTPTPPKKSKGPLIAGIAVAVMALLGAVLAVVLLRGNSDDDEAGPVTTIEAATTSEAPPSTDVDAGGEETTVPATEAPSTTTGEPGEETTTTTDRIESQAPPFAPRVSFSVDVAADAVTTPIEVFAGSRYVVIAETDDDVDVVLDVRSSDGTSLCREDSGLSGDAEFCIVESPGDRLDIAISSFSGTAGSVDGFHEEIGAPDGGGTASGTAVEVPIAATPGDTLLILAETSSPIDPVLIVNDSNGSELCRMDDGFDGESELCSVQPSGDGVVALVTSFGGDDGEVTVTAIR
jgi:hypothetical protein